MATIFGLFLKGHSAAEGKSGSCTPQFTGIRERLGMKFERYTVQELIDMDMLEEPLDGNHGSLHPKASDYVSSGIPFIMANNLVDGDVDLINCAFITEEQARTLRKGFSKSGDVLLTHKATIGRTAIVPEKYETVILTPQVTYYRVKKGIDNRFLKYYFDSPDFQATLNNWAGAGSTRAYLGIIAQHKLLILLPQIEEQRKIADVLWALDEKIKMNKMINKNLEEMLQAVYQQIFSSEPQNTLAEICSYSKDRVAVDKLTIDDYYSTENMLPQKAGATTATNLPTTPQAIKCHVGDVLISNIRPYFKKILYCYHDCGCSNDVLCFTPKSQDLSAFLYGTLYADHFFEFMVSGAKGTKMPRGDKQQIMTYPIALPSEEELDSFNSIAFPLMQKIYNNTSENVRLSAIRDTLLPRLMSGEIDVSNIDV